jgi:hypothetical protein
MQWLLAKSRVLTLAGLFGIGSIARGDSAVIVGAGQVGTWTTAAQVANPNSSTETLTISTVPFPCKPPRQCFVGPLEIPPLGSASLSSLLAGDFETFYVTQDETSPPAFPIVRASLINDASGPARSVDIPVVLVSRLMAANISTLNFADVVEEPPPPCAFGIPCFPPHSTLVLANIQRTDDASGEDLPLTLEVFDSDGKLAGSASLTIPYGQTALIGDVVAYLGAGPLGLGQLRITRVSGAALMWGVLYTTAVNGAVTASAGANLSP